MDIKKEVVDHLSLDDLKEVRGGIPYETPEIYDISNLNGECKKGRVCSNGHTDKCNFGTICDTGFTLDNDIEPV